MRFRLTLLLILLIILSLNVTHAQEEAPFNLLENGDFEAEFVALEGAEPRLVAEGWTPWHMPASDTSPSFANHNPNYDQETDRIRLDEEGSAQQYFTLFATHQAGIYQEVDSLESGTTYRFSIYAYVWSSSFEDADLSEDPGDVVVRVGIDPNGGTDAASEDIIWSTAATFFYDAYRQYAVIATAESATITVFVESTVSEPRANNYIFLDDAVLEVASETSADDDSTPTQETDAELSDETGTPTATGTVSVTPTATLSGAAQGDNTTTPESGGGGQASPTSPTSLAETLTPSPTSASEHTATPASSETPIGDDFPETVTHIVVAGDTVSALALEYDSTVAAINSANGLNASNFIYIGQRLVIPINPPDIQAQLAEVAPTETATPTATDTPTATPTMTPTFTLTPSPTPTPITYQVLPGDSLERIAQLYGTTIELLALQNAIVNVHRIDVGQILLIPTAVPPTATPTPIPTATPTPDPASLPTSPYTVQEGDTLGEIAAQFNTTIEAIAQLNGITNPSRIFPGQELQIPGAPEPDELESEIDSDATATDIPTPTPLPTSVPQTHRVQFGDTLYTIAASYGVSVVELAQLNSITNYDQLSIGQVLIIPG